ncbi:MAG: hypothetical protein QOI34_1539 [Verrucomicrobiota bacterium]
MAPLGADHNRQQGLPPDAGDHDPRTCHPERSEGPHPLALCTQSLCVIKGQEGVPSLALGMTTPGSAPCRCAYQRKAWLPPRCCHPERSEGPHRLALSTQCSLRDQGSGKRSLACAPDDKWMRQRTRKAIERYMPRSIALIGNRQCQRSVCFHFTGKAVSHVSEQQDPK